MPAGTGGTPDTVTVDISSLLPADEVTVNLSVTSSVDEQLTPAPVFLIDTVQVVLTVDENTTTDAFTYDAAGRMLTRDVDGTVTTLTWDASSNLTSTTADGVVTIYAYDAGGQRVAQATLAAGSDPGTASAYVAGMELTDPNTAVANNVTGTRFYTFGGATVAVRTAQGLSLLLGDEQGSAQIMMPLRTDPATGALLPATQADADATERTAYAPYGARRGDDLEDINRGWLGQVEDTGTGLTYLNARYYDPAIGRFLSPDPLMNLGDPRTLDPYRYADNNPVVYTDVTGLCPGCSMDQMKLYGALTSGNVGNLANTAVLQQSTAYSAARTNARGSGARIGSTPYGGALPALGSGALVGVPSREGQVVVSFWIEDTWAGVPGVGFNDAAGDARGPARDTRTMWDHSRFVFSLDLAGGRYHHKTAPSCDWPETNSCHDALKPTISVTLMDPEDTPFGALSKMPRWKDMYQYGAEGDVAVRLTFDGRDSATTHAPPLEQTVYLLLRANSEQIGVFRDGDTFPSFQVARTSGGGFTSVHYESANSNGAAALAGLAGVAHGAG